MKRVNGEVIDPDIPDGSVGLEDLDAETRAAIESGTVPTTFTAVSSLAIDTTDDELVALLCRVRADDGSVRWAGTLKLYHHDDMGASVDWSIETVGGDPAVFSTPPATASGTGDSTVLTVSFATVASGRFTVSQV